MAHKGDHSSSKNIIYSLIYLYAETIMVMEIATNVTEQRVVATCRGRNDHDGNDAESNAVDDMQRPFATIFTGFGEADKAVYTTINKVSRSRAASGVLHAVPGVDCVAKD